MFLKCYVILQVPTLWNFFLRWLATTLPHTRVRIIYFEQFIKPIIKLSPQHHILVANIHNNFNKMPYNKPTHIHT